LPPTSITKPTAIPLIDAALDLWKGIENRHERAFRVCNTFADVLAAIEPGWGLLGGKSPSQNGWSFGGERYAVDIVCNQVTKEMFDCLVDATDQDEPAWQKRNLSPNMNWGNWRPVVKSLLSHPHVPPIVLPPPVVVTPSDTLLLKALTNLDLTLQAQTRALEAQSLELDEQTALLTRYVDRLRALEQLVVDIRTELRLPRALSARVRFSGEIAGQLAPIVPAVALPAPATTT
jgi:hypothetical protein